MSKPVLAVDIDEVLAPFVEELARHHNNLHQTELELKHFFSYDFWHVWGGTRDEAIAKVRYFHDSGASSDVKPFPEALAALRQIKNQYDLQIVTSRQLEYEELTRRWLERNFAGVFSAAHFGNHYQEDITIKPTNKSDLCKSIGANWLVDDSLVYARECAGKGIKVLLFGDYPWNQADELPEGVTRVKDWDEVLKVLLPDEA